MDLKKGEGHPLSIAVKNYSTLSAHKCSSSNSCKNHKLPWIVEKIIESIAEEYFSTEKAYSR